MKIQSKHIIKPVVTILFFCISTVLHGQSQSGTTSVISDQDLAPFLNDPNIAPYLSDPSTIVFAPEPGSDPDTPAIPVDGGLGFLLAAGVAYGAKQLRSSYKKK